MGKLLEALAGSGIVGAAAVIVVGVAAYYLRPKERRLRKLERLSALRASLGERGEELDEEIDRLVGLVADDLEREEYRIARSLEFFLSLAVAMGSLYWLVPSIALDMDAVEIATGYRSRFFGTTFGLSMLLFGVAGMLGAGNLWATSENLFAQIREAKRDQRSRAKAEHVPSERDDPRTGVGLEPGAARAGSLGEEPEDVQSPAAHGDLDPRPGARGEGGQSDR